MLISTELESIKKCGSNEDALTLLKNAGFDAYDFSMFLDTKDCFIYDKNYRERAAELRRFADGIGIVCNQAHAPFPMYLPTANVNWSKYLIEVIENGLKVKFDKDVEGQFAEAVKTLVKRSIEIAGILGAKHIVIHPNNNKNASQNYQMYMEYYQTAKENNIKIALENMFNWNDEKDYALSAACSNEQDFIEHLNLLDKETFVACVDVGHAEMYGLNTSASKMIKGLGDRLKCLHIHDNNKHHDLHNLPFTNNINFNEMIDALAEIGYDGDITLEAPSYIGRFDKEFYPIAVKYMAEICNYIKKKLQTKLNAK